MQKLQRRRSRQLTCFSFIEYRRSAKHDVALFDLPLYPRLRPCHKVLMMASKLHDLAPQSMRSVVRVRVRVSFRAPLNDSCISWKHFVNLPFFLNLFHDRMEGLEKDDMTSASSSLSTSTQADFRASGRM